MYVEYVIGRHIRNVHHLLALRKIIIIEYLPWFFYVIVIKFTPQMSSNLLIDIYVITRFVVSLDLRTQLMNLFKQKYVS